MRSAQDASAVARPMGDAHDVTREAAVEEESLDGARQVAVVGVAVDVEKLVPAAEQYRLVERTARGQPDEPGNTRVRDGERLGPHLFRGRIYAGRPNLSDRSHPLVYPFAVSAVSDSWAQRARFRRAELVSPVFWLR